MRSRGQEMLALGVTALVVLGGVALERTGPASPAEASAGQATSGAWFCPHAGGKDWRGMVYLANPGSVAVSARLTPMSSEGPIDPILVSVPAGAEVAQTVPVTDRSSSTYVEYFGGWIGAGWLTRVAGSHAGVGAEPCAPAASRRWFAPDNTTQQGQEANLVIMNPFAAEAVLDVVLYTANRAPIRISDYADVSIKPLHSLALPLSAVGEQAITASVEVSTGRVAVASVGVSDSGGVRSTLGVTSTTSRTYLPVALGIGQSQLVVTVPGEAAAALGGSLLTRDGPSPLPGLVGTTQEPATAQLYPLVSAGPTSANLVSTDGVGIVAALRASGPEVDPASTAGALIPAAAWIVTPTVAGGASRPGLVLVNPGDVAVDVTLHLLAPQGAAPAADITVTVPPASAKGAPAAFLGSATDASVLVRASGGDIVALGASTSLGPDGTSAFALAVGVPVVSMS
jgi:hypothetical protein